MITPERRYGDNINDSSAVRGFYDPYMNDRSVLSASRHDGVGYQDYQARVDHQGRGAVPDASMKEICQGDMLIAAKQKRMQSA